MGGEHEVGGVGPKIVALLGRPEAAGARLELATCERLGISPSQFRGRPTVTTCIYDGARLVRTVTASPWGEEDRALMLAWCEYKASLCEGCGHPKATAWHPDNADAGFVLVEEITCWACTAAKKPGEDGQTEPVTYPVVLDIRDYDQHPLPALEPIPTTPLRERT